MAMEEIAAVTAVANETSNVPRFYQPIVMARRDTGAPLGPAQDNIPPLPESLSHYLVEAPAPSPEQEMLPISYRERVQKDERRLEAIFSQPSPLLDTKKPHTRPWRPATAPPYQAAAPLQLHRRVDVLV